MSTKSRKNRKVEPGSIFGEFLVLAHDREELWQVRCTSPAGHKSVRPAATILSPYQTCKSCKWDRLYGSNVGKTFGTVTITGIVEKRNRLGHRAPKYTTKCICGHEGEIAVREVMRGQVSGKDCRFCKQARLTAAINDPTSFSDVEARAIDKAITRGLRAVLSTDEIENHGDLPAIVWIEVLQYPSIKDKTPDQIAGVANRVARRVAVSTIKVVNDELYKQLPPAKIDGGDTHFDTFDSLEVEPQESESDELQSLALDSLSENEREFMYAYQSTVGKKSKRDKQLFKDLTDKARAALGSILAELGETPTESRGQCGA